MSLINQMLRDLEHRRTTESGSSPLGGLSASGVATQSLQFSINYKTLGALVAALFLAGVIAAYLLGSQQSSAIDESKPAPVEKSVSMVVQEVKPAQTAPTLEKEAVTVAPDTVKESVASEASVLRHEQTIKAVAVANKSEAMPTPIVVVAKQQGKPASKAVSKTSPIVIKEARGNVATEAVVEENVDKQESINKTVRPLTDEQQAQLAFQRAVKLLGQGKQASAQNALLEALQFLPAHIQARETLAALMLNNGQVSEAASSLREGLQLTPGATALAKLYARILVDQGDVNEAMVVLERARPVVSADPDYFALMAALYRQEKKHAQAALIYQQILLQRPGVANWWMGLALAQDAMGENAKALDAFQRAQRAGGLNKQVLAYVQSRIVALTPAVEVSAQPVDQRNDELGD